MKRFTDKMIKKNLCGKGLHECIQYLESLNITVYTVYRNSKGHPVEMFIKFAGSEYAGWARSIYFDKNTGLCIFKPC